MKPEHELYHRLARWFQEEHPNVIYRFDLAADLKLTIGQARKHKELHPKRGYPDLFIAEPRGGYCGMYVELKADGNSPYKRNGELKKSEHLQEQSDFIHSLKQRDYFAVFATGFDEATTLISQYLKGGFNGRRDSESRS